MLSFRKIYFVLKSYVKKESKSRATGGSYRIWRMKDIAKTGPLIPLRNRFARARINCKRRKRGVKEKLDKFEIPERKVKIID